MRTCARRGFTLMELLIVVAIIGILTAIGIPMLAGQLEKTRETVCLSNRQSARHVLLVQQMTEGEMTQAQLSAYLADEQDIVCPSGGDYTVVKTGEGITEFVITCSKHGGDDASISLTLRGDVNNLIAKWDTSGGNWMNNDSIRKAYLAANGGAWPTLAVGGESYYLQPYYSASTGQVYIYANPTATNWNAKYIYNPVDGKWYTDSGYGNSEYRSPSLVKMEWSSDADIDRFLKSDNWHTVAATEVARP